MKKTRQQKRQEQRDIRQATVGRKLSRFGRVLSFVGVIGLDEKIGYCIRVWHPLGFIVMAGSLLLSPIFALFSDASVMKYWRTFLTFARPRWLFWLLVAGIVVALVLGR